MKIYLGIKFYENNSNKELIEQFCSLLEAEGHEVYCVVRDLEKWGKFDFTPNELMQKTFEIIDHCDLVLIEFSEKGVGLGIEAGYAYCKQVPIHIVAKNGSDISNTMKGIASKVSFYDNVSDLKI